MALSFRTLSALLVVALVPAVPASAGPAESVTARNLDIGIREIAAVYRLEPALIKAVISVESGFNLRAVSPKGARGLMQLMPLTASQLGVEKIYDAWENIEAGARYLRDHLDRFGGDLPLALAAYNAGEGAVRSYGGVPPYPETRRYVADVLARYEAFRHQKALAPSSGQPSGGTTARVVERRTRTADDQVASREPTPLPRSEPAIVLKVEDRPWPEEGRRRLEEGLRSEKDGDVARAGELYRNALAVDPSLDEAANRLGLLALRSGQLDEARRRFEQGLRIQPAGARFLNNLGLAYYLGGDFRTARRLFREAWERPPRPPESGLNLALAHAQLGERSQAEAILRDIRAVSPTVPPEWYLHAGGLREAEGDRAGAVSHYRRFLDLTTPQDSAVWSRVAARLVVLGAR